MPCNEAYDDFIKSPKGLEVMDHIIKASSKIMSHNLPEEVIDINIFEFRQMFVKCFLHMMIGCDEQGKPKLNSDKIELAAYPTPEKILDDLGIHHEVEVPLAAYFKKMPCPCGTIHKWEQPETFELYSIEMILGGRSMGYPDKILKRCRICKETLLLEKIKD